MTTLVIPGSRAFIVRLSSSAIGAAVYLLLSTGTAQEFARPLRLFKGDSCESQVDEISRSWVVRHDQGLTVIAIDSGEARNVVDRPASPNVPTSRLITADGRFFGYFSEDRSRLTVARVADGKTIWQAESNVVGSDRNSEWPDHVFLGDKGAYVIVCVVRRRACEVLRIDPEPTPRVTASQVLGPGAHMIYSTGHEPGLVAATSSELQRPPKKRNFRLYDNELKLLNQQEILGPWTPFCVIDLRGPRVLLISVDRAPRTHNFWQLTGRQDEKYAVLRSGTFGRPGRGFASLLCGALSPDGQWIVMGTGLVDGKPTVGLWSVASGELSREVILDPDTAGAVGEVEDSHAIVFRLDFSASGKYLNASSHSKSYLFEFEKLVSGSTVGSLAK